MRVLISIPLLVVRGIILVLISIVRIIAALSLGLERPALEASCKATAGVLVGERRVVTVLTSPATSTATVVTIFVIGLSGPNTIYLLPNFLLRFYLFQELSQRRLFVGGGYVTLQFWIQISPRPGELVKGAIEAGVLGVTDDLLYVACWFTVAADVGD